MTMETFEKDEFIQKHYQELKVTGNIDYLDMGLDIWTDSEFWIHYRNEWQNGIFLESRIDHY